MKEGVFSEMLVTINMTDKYDCR